MSEVEDKIQLGDYVGAYIAIRNQRDTLKRKFGNSWRGPPKKSSRV